MSIRLKKTIGGLKGRGFGSRGKMVPWLNRFRRDEDGAVIAFTLFTLIMFLLMAGIGIDIMRHEMERTRLAAVADAASLAGAAAPNNDAAKAVVRDYFAKAGMSDNLEDFGEDDVQITLNTSKVTVNTSVQVDTYLLKLAGIDSIGAAADATAEKRVPKLEISLVLDVSGSMEGDKLTNLKSAAKQFVTTILNSADPGDAIISVVPFSFGVTPSDNMYAALDVLETNNRSRCIVFQDSDYSDTAIVPEPLNPALPKTTYAQQIYTSRYDISGNFNTLNSSWRSCYLDSYFRILPFSISESDLHTMIDALQADGNTSGNEGIKWGAALLDPAFQPMVSRLITAGDVNAGLTNVPATYNELATQKVIVMMGDGKNTSSYYFNDPNDLLNPDTPEIHTSDDYRGPESDLWRVTYNGGNVAYFLYSSRYNDYTDIDDIHSSTYLTQAEFDDLENTVTGWQSQDQLDWEDAWALMSPDYHKSVTGVSDAYDDYATEEQVTGTTKNTQMDASCTATKAQKVVVYTIGFEISEGGTAERELRDCATSPSNYYRAEGVNINDAFNSIATNIQNLRLTQ